MGLLVVAIAVVIVVAVFSSVQGEVDAGRRLDRIWRTGAPARARIIAVRDTKARLGGRPHQIRKLAFDLEIEPPQGTPHRASVTFYVRPEVRDRLQEGAELDVRVDVIDSTLVSVDPELRLLGDRNK